MYTGKPPMEQRVGAAIATALVLGAIGWAALLSLSQARRVARDEALPAIAVLPVPSPSPPVVPERQPSTEPEGEAAPPNVRSTPTEIVAPPVAPLVPPPVPAATVTGTQADATAGAAELPGPGQGAGGIGDGRGSGGAGDGTGGGLAEAPPRRVRGRLEFSDAARVVGWENAIGRAMTTRFTVEADGRVTGCRATRSSGLAELDAAICGLIERRFRYRPARDAAGRPVRAGVEVDHYWEQG